MNITYYISRIWFISFMTFIIIKEGESNMDSAIIAAIISAGVLVLLDLISNIRGYKKAAKAEQVKELRLNQEETRNKIINLRGTSSKKEAAKKIDVAYNYYIGIESGKKSAAFLAAIMAATAMASIGTSAWSGAEYQFDDTYDNVDICPAHSDRNHDYKFTGESRKSNSLFYKTDEHYKCDCGKGYWEGGFFGKRYWDGVI